MKKTLLLSENFPPIDGGSGRWFWELYSRLPKDKVIVCAHDIEGGVDFDSRHDVTVIRIPLRSAEWGFKSIAGLKFYWSCITTVRKIIKEHQIEEVHCGRVLHEGVTAWIIKLLTGVPFRCFVHGEDIETAATSREQALLVKQVCKHATSLVCNSYNSKHLLKTLGFSQGENAVVLHPGVDTGKFKPSPIDNRFRKDVGWGENSLTLLTVGRLQQRKGQDFLIQALPEIRKIHPNIHYAIVGRGEEETRLRQLVEEFSLEQCVSIHTDFNDEQLVRAYQQCDIFILPNRTIGNDIEGFGMVLVEAQACGKPAIAGRSGGTSETLLENETGSVIDCSSPDQIVQQLPAAIVLCKTLDSDSVYQYACTQFNWEKHTGEFKALLGKSE